MFHGHREHAEERALLRGEITDKMGVFATVSAGGGTKMALCWKKQLHTEDALSVFFLFLTTKNFPSLESRLSQGPT